MADILSTQMLVFLQVTHDDIPTLKRDRSLRQRVADTFSKKTTPPSCTSGVVQTVTVQGKICTVVYILHTVSTPCRPVHLPPPFSVEYFSSLVGICLSIVFSVIYIISRSKIQSLHSK